MIFINVKLFIKLKLSETLLEVNYFLSTLNKLAIKNTPSCCEAFEQVCSTSVHFFRVCYWVAEAISGGSIELLGGSLKRAGQV